MTTDNKTLAVDVLNEMERASSRLFDAGLHGDLSLDEARAAVAELIEADDEYDAACDALDCIQNSTALRTYRYLDEATKRYERARIDRINALARVKGESA